AVVRGVAREPSDREGPVSRHRLHTQLRYEPLRVVRRAAARAVPVPRQARPAAPAEGARGRDQARQGPARVSLAGARRAAGADPWPVLAERRVVHDRLGDQELVILYQPGTLSALDAPQIQRSRAVGATGAFRRVLESRALTFEATGEGFRDRETGSSWTLLGHAIKGALAGRRLTAVPHVDAFWFAWAAFNPTTTVYADR